jgi:hypothetical protein
MDVVLQSHWFGYLHKSLKNCCVSDGSFQKVLTISSILFRTVFVVIPGIGSG